MQVTINPLPVMFVTNPAAVCAPKKVDLTDPAVTAGSIGATNLTYWTDAACTIQLSSPYAVNQDGTYFIKSTTDQGCTAVQPVVAVINSAPIADFVPTPALMTTMDTESQMINNSIDAVSYVWDFGDYTQSSTETSPTHIFPDNKTAGYSVMLIATSLEGCVDTMWVAVHVSEELIYYVPNTFTPDGDGHNETFKPVFTSGYAPTTFTMLIFDRWGEIVFESHDPSAGWTGTYGTGGVKVQDGTYTWKIDFRTSMTDQRILVVGHVNVLH